jgi:hypothetical protein
MAATQVTTGTNALTTVRPSGRLRALAAIVALVAALAITLPLIPETIWNGLKTVVLGLAVIGALWLGFVTALFAH